MSSSINNPSLINLALLNQLLQRANGDATGTTSADTTGDSQATQDSTSGMSFGQQADALLEALDTDGDGKLSKAELQTGFQKLSQDMRSFLIDQQNVGSSSSGSASNTASSIDTDGDSTPSQPEVTSAFASNEAPAGNNSLQLVAQLVQTAENTTDTDAATSSAASSSNSALGTSETWDSWMQQAKGRAVGDVANQTAMNSFQQSNKMDNALTQLLQAIERFQSDNS